MIKYEQHPAPPLCFHHFGFIFVFDFVNCLYWFFLCMQNSLKLKPLKIQLNGSDSRRQFDIIWVARDSQRHPAVRCVDVIVKSKVTAAPLQMIFPDETHGAAPVCKTEQLTVVEIKMWMCFQKGSDTELETGVCTCQSYQLNHVGTSL